MKKKKPSVKARASKALARVQNELPATLREFQRRVTKRLNELERELERAEAQGRRKIARLIRVASQQLGRLEAQGEQRWRKATTQARRDALRLLRGLEKRIEGPKPARRKPAAPRPAATPVPMMSPPGVGGDGGASF
jgi:hypothetical protein